MFYSQFILAKKGPLGTIWIAAHLERKLRKNQVADTNIGDSVDSILFPDVPIALRLSSHLLLGVVRIYNRKVNYLFDDCSEALLNVKQAFRSTAVDLPPEESKAPYHSITLPEKFDLDDFELPDNDIFQGNYVDQHISSRDQITLQDTMEGVSYSTSKFGLDERFGDGDMSGLDLDEELFLEKIGTEGHADERADPQASFRSTLTIKQDPQPEDRAANSEAMVVGVDELDDVMDYAQAPRTPGLVEEPNLSNVQDASACDDHLEAEYHLMASTMKENAINAPCEDKQKVDWCSGDDTIANAVPQGPTKENGNHSSGLEVKELMPQGQIESMRQASEFTNEFFKAYDNSPREDAPTEAVNEDHTYFLSVDETCGNHQGRDEISLEKSVSGASGLACPEQHVCEDVSTKDLAPLGGEVSGNVGDMGIQQKSCHGGLEIASENQVGFVDTPETQASGGATDPSALNAHDKEAAKDTLILTPYDSIPEKPNVAEPGFSRTIDGDLKSDNNALVADGREETANPGEDIQVAISEADGLVHTTNSQERLVENLNNPAPAESELPAPEKLLSVPEGHTDLHKGMTIEVSPVDIGGLDEGDIGSKTAAGRKRSFTESTLTEQSLNSVESSRQVRAKQLTGSVPNDEDLLSSILVGRRSSMLRVKPTPPLSEVTSMKRIRSAPRSGAPKRKVLMDNTMVLHGDTIRQQLTSTEDIRRVRKKAPCTLPEISMIQKQHMEEENFLHPVFTGMSVDLASLHDQVYDLSRISISYNEVNDASLGNLTEQRLSFQNNENVVPSETMGELNLASYNEKSSGHFETMEELHLMSLNNRNSEIEDDIEPFKANVIEVSGTGLNDEFLTVRDNKTAEPSVSPLQSENKLEEVDRMSIASPPVIAEIEPLDASGHATGDMGDALHGMVQTTSLNESGETNACVNTDAAVVSDQKKAEFDHADLGDGEEIVRNEDREDGYSRGEAETELGEMDGILQDATQDNSLHGDLEYHAQGEIFSNIYEEQKEVEFSCPGPEIMLQEGSMDNSENPDRPETNGANLMEAEISGFDLHDRDELNYSAVGDDTEFLNFDDDELTEMADDYMPDAEEARITENSGWSSRTRAVSKYLQLAFIKEAERGKKSLSLDNLLTGKSRKEASRMFFETLVLKTRDYIHVEQQNPCDDISIKPRTRLLKFDF